MPADDQTASHNPGARAKQGAHLPSWLVITELGLWCEPRGFYIDPHRAVDHAVITHGHSDHARPGHAAVLATSATLDIIRARFGDGGAGSLQRAAYGEKLRVRDVSVSLLPAGHILGSAQVLLEYRGCRVVVSGDYKRRRDPTCAPFMPIPCDIFVTEATFGLPVFRHPADAAEIERLLASLRLFPERCHLIGVYALGKCQRLIALLREAGYDRPIYLHGGLTEPCSLYENHGISLGPLVQATGARRNVLAGEIVLCPPSARAAYSRSGDSIAEAFPEILEALTTDAVLDGELLIVRDGVVAPFSDLQQRLGRKNPSRSLRDRFPAHVRLYDILFDGLGIPFTDLRGDGSVRGWTAHSILAVGSITHGRSRRWTSGSAAPRDAGSISSACVGRMVSPARTAAWPGSHGRCRMGCCGAGVVVGAHR